MVEGNEPDPLDLEMVAMGSRRSGWWLSSIVAA